MLRFGTISYNIYGNFTNYGSALQTWALHLAINKLGNGKWEAILVDYCPDILKDKDILNPFGNLWDKDEEARTMCELSLPAIQENYKKFNYFYHDRFHRTKKKYTSSNFNDVVADEGLNGFICGSDTIFCIDEFGFDDGYYANYSCMKDKYTVSYAASFGDSHFKAHNLLMLNQRLQNFKALGLREKFMLPYIKRHIHIPAQQVIDPTLLLTSETYDRIAAPRVELKPYILYYSRRYNPEVEKYVDQLSHTYGLKVIEISLRAINANKHTMFYNAGVEEFLSLVKYAEFIVTNSYHGMIFSIQYKRPFALFSREQCDNKNIELLKSLGLTNRLNAYDKDLYQYSIDYGEVYKKIAAKRKASLKFLEFELSGYYDRSEC